jgi:predicted small metal-binding protein
MAKGLRCSDVGFACDATINADDEDAVMTQAAQHAKDVHGLTDQDLERHGASIRHDPRRLVPRPSRPGRRQRLGAEVTLFKVWRDLPGSGGLSPLSPPLRSGPCLNPCKQGPDPQRLEPVGERHGRVVVPLVDAYRAER